MQWPCLKSQQPLPRVLIPKQTWHGRGWQLRPLLSIHRSLSCSQVGCPRNADYKLACTFKSCCILHWFSSSFMCISAIPTTGEWADKIVNKCLVSCPEVCFFFFPWWIRAFFKGHSFRSFHIFLSQIVSILNLRNSHSYSYWHNTGDSCF